MKANTNYKNPKKIVKNTVYLYIRMIILLIISLYTSRLVLKELGITDYGIYNVIGGLITIFSFVNNSMSQASQRFITYELGKGNISTLRNIFSTCVYIHIALAILIVVLGESIGLWYIYHVAVIPPERFNAALWVYHCSIIVSCASIITVPYNALIIAHERMSAFAYLTIIESILKLSIVFLLMYMPFDKLVIYGILMAVLAVFMRLLYGIYSNRTFNEAKLVSRIDVNYLRSMGGYAGWSLCGSLATAGYSQGLNLLINAFFNPAINAARGVAVTVQSVIRNFSGNFQVAVNPQITKSYAVKDLRYMHDLIYRASLYSYFLYFLIAFPAWLEIDTLLGLWLVDVPTYTSIFIRILLIISAIEVLASPLNVSAQATGKIRDYELITSLLLLLIVPLAYIFLLFSPKPENVFLVFLFQVFLAYIARILLLKRKIGLMIGKYVKFVIAKILLVSVIAIIVPIWVHSIVTNEIMRLFCVGGTCIIVTPCVFFLLGLNGQERIAVVSKVSQWIHKNKCSQDIG